MNDMKLEQEIRKRAFELWQLDGSLEGCADEYWHLARILVEAEIEASSGTRNGVPDVMPPVDRSSACGRRDT